MKTNSSENIVDQTLVQECSCCIYKSLLFDTLDPKALNKISGLKKQSQFQKGERICVEGERIENLIYIHKGLVKLSRRNEDGQVQILSIARPLDYVGLISVFSSNKYKYSITAIEPTSVCFIDLECIRDTIKSKGDFAMEIVEKMSQASDEVLEARYTLSKKTLKAKLAYILLYFAETIYESYSFELPISRTEIAELVDMRSENVIRIMSDLKKNNIIKTKGQKVEILDVEQLRLING